MIDEGGRARKMRRTTTFEDRDKSEAPPGGAAASAATASAAKPDRSPVVVAGLATADVLRLPPEKILHVSLPSILLRPAVWRVWIWTRKSNAERVEAHRRLFEALRDLLAPPGREQDRFSPSDKHFDGGLRLWREATAAWAVALRDPLWDWRA